MYDKTNYNKKKKETKSTYVNKDTIQTFNWHKLQKELYIFHEKMAILPISSVYKTWVLKIWNTNEIRPFNTIAIMISDEVRWRKDQRCTELQLLTFYFIERKWESETKWEIWNKYSKILTSFCCSVFCIFYTHDHFKSVTLI